MKKFTLALLMFAVTCFTYGQTTVTKTYAGPTVTVDGCGSYCVALPSVTFVAGDFTPGCTTITDVEISIDWLKTDGSCGAPGAGNSFHNETNFRIDGPAAMEILATPGTWTGAVSSPPVTTVFDQAAAGPPVVGTPVSGTFQPNGGNLDNFNGLSALGAWNLAAGDTAGSDPLCVIAYSVTITVGAANDICATASTIDPVAGGTISGDTTCATDSGVANCAGFSTSPDVWYTFTDTTGTGMIVDVNTCSAASTYDTVLNVYTGSCGALVCVGGDDDDPSCAIGPFAGLNSRVPFVTDGSSTYWVKVNGFSSGSGAFDLNYSSCVIAITCPADVVVSNDPGACEATGVALGTPTTNGCPGEIVSNDAPAAFPVGLTVVTWTVTDASGTAVATCMQNVTVNDTQDPLIGCPADITVNNDPGVCGAAVAYGVAFSDNCPGSTLAQTAGQASGTVFPIGTTTNTFIVTDASGNTATCSFDVTVSDTEPPVIVCPADIVVNNDPGVCGATVAYATPVGTDNCPGATTSQTAGQASGTVFPVGTTTNTFEVTDASGNTATCSFDVTVNDTEDPVITCPADITVSNDPGLCSAVVNYTVTATDNCGIPGPPVEYISNGDFETGTLAGWTPMVTGAGMFTINDGTPVPDGPGTATAPINGSFDLLSQQNNPSTHMVSQPIVVPAGVAAATVSWNDRIRNHHTVFDDPLQEFKVEILDAGMLPIQEIFSTNPGDPLIQIGPNARSFDLTALLQTLGGQTIYLSFFQNTQLFFFNVNLDDISLTIQTGLAITQTAGLPSGSAFPVGTTTNTFVATDAAGNTDTCSFDVTVNDTEPPVAVCAVGPALNPSEAGVPLGQPIPATGTSGPMTPSVATVTDSGVLGVDYNLDTVELDLNHTFDGDLDISLTSPMGTVLQLSNDNGGSGNNYTGTIFQDGGANINLGSAPFTGIFEPEGGTFAAAFGGQDINGNWTLNIQDNFGGDSGQLLNFRVNFMGLAGGPVQVVLDGTGNASITVADIDAGSTDNCGIASTSIDITDFTCADIGINVVTLTVTDVNGNVSTCTSDVLVIDDQPPVAVCQDITVQLDANGMASIVPADIDGGSTDNCAITLDASQTDFTCADVGVNVVTLTVTDEGGNVTTCTANVTVEDNVPPVAVCNDFDVFLDASGMVSITAADVDGGSTDACGIAGISIDIMDFTCADIGPNNVTLTVTDNNGNMSTCVGVVTVIDDIPPVIACPADVNTNTDPGQCSAVVTFPNAIALDNCMVTVAQTGGLPSGSPFPVGINFVEFTATDAGGNTAVCTMTITVTDNEDPVVVCNDLTVELDASGNVTVDVNDVATVTDNCPGATILFGGLTPGALTTSFADNNGFSGNMFDVMPLNDITVNSFDVNNSDGSVDYEVYMKTGSYVGSESTPGDWTLVGTALGVPGAGGGNPTPLNLSMGVNLTAGNMVSFYVAQTNGTNHNYINGAVEGALWASDANLEIFEGVGKAGPAVFTGGTFRPRNFSGTIIYESGNPPSTTLDFTCADVGPNTVQVTATDASGNTATCMTTITVEDNIAPIIVCIGEQLTGPNTVSDSPGTAIVDNTTVSTTITVPDSFTITDLNVDMNITHTWVGDLTITLESPALTQVVIFDGSVDGCSGDNIMDLYDDESGNPLVCDAGSGDAFPLADYIPSNALSAFDGEDTAGVWTLFVADGAGGDQGTIDSWSLIYDFDPIVSTPLEVDLDANGMATILASDLLLSVDEACGWTATVAGVGPPVSLETTFAGGNGNFGNMFDMNALNDVTVESFDIHGDTGATFDVEVYAKTGTYVGFETDPGAWTLIGTAPGVVSNGDGVATPLDLMLGYEMSAGETHAFYVTPTDFSTGGFNYTNGTGVGNVFASDANIEFLEGSGSGYPFNGTLFSPRVWNGNIIYTAGGGMSTTIDFTCADLGENIIEVTVTDDSGNVATCMATVNVNDVTPPILICMDVTIELDENGVAEIDPNDLLAVMPSSYEVITISSDNQSGAVGNTDLTVPVTAGDNISFDWMYNTSDGPAFDSFGYLLNGVYTEVIDPGGANTQMGTTGPIAVAPGDVFGFRSTSVDGLFGPSTTVVSNFIPGFTGQFEPANWTLTLDNSDGDAFFVEIPGGPLSFDACGIEILAVDITEVTCDDIGTPVVITVFASDSSLNPAVCQSTVTVVDLLGPVMTCPADQTVDPGVGNLFWEVEDYFALGTASATDNCTDPVTILTQDPAPGTLLPDGVYTITISGEDEYGNIGVCTFELTVESILGINTVDISTIVMYPNPARNVVNISNPQSIDLEQAAIYDVTGRLIQTYDLRDMGTEKALDVSRLSTATYLVLIQGQDGQITKQLIKE